MAWKKGALGTMDRNVSDNTHPRIGLLLLFVRHHQGWMAHPLSISRGAALDVESDKPAYGGDTSS